MQPVAENVSSFLRRRAFSLIELLVVVSIIALILAILLPALSGARQTSRAALCLSRLRALGAGWHMYADDNNDIAVPGRMFNRAGGLSNPLNWYDVGNGMSYRPRWIATMGKYVGIYAHDRPRVDVDRLKYDSPAYQCPAAPDRMDNRNHAFGYNHQFLGNARQANGSFIRFPVNRSSIASFAGTVMAADCMGTAAGLPAAQRRDYNPLGTDFAEIGNHGWTLDPPRLTATSDRGTGDAGSPRTAVDPRHVGRANLLFCDGHAERMLPRQVGYRTDDDGTYIDDGVDANGESPTNSWFSGTARDDDPPSLSPPAGAFP